MDHKERYLVTMENGERKNVVASTFQEVLLMLGEENVTQIEKLDYKED